MKKLFLSTILAGLTILMTAQSPQKMSYQAVIRNAGNQLTANQQVSIRISILQGSVTGVAMYVETHLTTTNSNGLATIDIGGGAPVTGTFTGIDWSSGPYFIRTETDLSGGTNYTITGTSQLLSVPYALYAKSAENGFSGAWTDISGKPTTLAGYGITDADGSIINEIQTLGINGSQLSLSNGGGTVAIPSSADNWGSQVAVTDATLSGNGTSVTPLRIAQQSATTGQVLKWSGTTWNPSTDLTGEFTLPYLGFTNTQNGLVVVNSSTLENASALAGSVGSTSANANTGVAGLSSSSNGSGVTGTANASSGSTNGVLGISKSGTGRGVYGLADATSGFSYGVYGSAASIQGIGVYGTSPNFGLMGVSSATSGNGVAVRGEAFSPGGYSGYFTGGMFSVYGNVGINTPSPSSALEVNGQVKITGGNPGSGKILMSDANGLASWQTPAADPWQHNGSSLYYNGGKVGIGISDPYYKFEIYDDYIPYQKFMTSTSGTGITAGFLVGFNFNNTAFLWNHENGSINIATNDKLAMMIDNNGNVGIGGMVAMTARLEVDGQVRITGGNPAAGKVFTADDNNGYGSWQVPAILTSGSNATMTVSGNLGIGNPSPNYKLDVIGNRIRLSDGTDWIALRTDGTSGMVDLSSNGKLVVQGTATTDDILLNPALASKVGIRTWVPMYDLDVDGNIRATGSVYYGGNDGSANGAAYSKPDYVFENDYEAFSTSDVAEFLRNEKHLPWITSAKQEAKENGDVTDMTRMAFETVETVENLQLQIIEMDKKIKMLSDLVISLQQKIESAKEQDK